MIKTLTIAQCDACGKISPAKPCSGQYNETEYVLPDGWKKSEYNDQFCICQECRKKFEMPILNYRELQE